MLKLRYLRLCVRVPSKRTENPIIWAYPGHNVQSFYYRLSRLPQITGFLSQGLVWLLIILCCGDPCFQMDLLLLILKLERTE